MSCTVKMQILVTEWSPGSLLLLDPINYLLASVSEFQLEVARLAVQIADKM